MDRLLHLANALVSLAAIAAAPGPLAAAGAGITGLLSWQALRPVPPRPDLAQAIAQTLRTALAAPGVTDDQRALIPQMIEATLPDPAQIVGANLDPAALIDSMAARLREPEHRLPANLTLFRAVLTPALTRLLGDPAFVQTLAPAYTRAVLAHLAANGASLERIEDKIDLLPGQFADLLGNLNLASRDQLEAIAARFDIPEAHRLPDAALRRELDARAEDWRALRSQIDAIPETLRRLSNLKGAAQAAFDAGRFEEVEALLEQVHAAELSEAARTAELRADTLLLRGQVDRAYALLAAAADSFARIDPLETARQRVRYQSRLYLHGLRYGGPGLHRALDLLAPVLTDTLRAQDAWLWAAGMNGRAVSLVLLGARTGGAEGAALLAQAVAADHAALEVLTRADHALDWAATQNNLGNALAEQGTRTGGAEGAALLAQAVAAFHAALQVRSRADHPVGWAITQNNRGNALTRQGTRTGGAEGAALLAQAVTAHRAALEVRTRSDHPVDWATTQNNLGAALAEQGTLTGGAEGAELLAQAVAAYHAALQVFTRADHPVDWATTQNNLGAALSQLGTRTVGAEGATLLAKSVAAFHAALQVHTRADRPVDWAGTRFNLALAELRFADHDTCTDPGPHLRASLAHVTAALEVFDPLHMPANHQTAISLRDHLRARLGHGED